MAKKSSCFKITKSGNSDEVILEKASLGRVPTKTIYDVQNQWSRNDLFGLYYKIII